MKNVVPILRIFDEAKAKEFYVDYLGFVVEWEHRFGPEFPLYIGIASGEVRLHLSEHHGDACPGAAVRVEVEDVEALQRILLDKASRFTKPEIEDKPWGAREMEFKDPFGNRLIFWERS